jgi:hypothetical protein
LRHGRWNQDETHAEKKKKELDQKIIVIKQAVPQPRTFLHPPLHVAIVQVNEDETQISQILPRKTQSISNILYEKGTD